MAAFFKVAHAVYRAVCRDPNTLRVYLELASRARWTPGTCLGSHGIVDLEPGQCLMGRAELAAAVGLTERAVRTSIERLTTLRVLAIQTTKRGTVVTFHEHSVNAEAWPSERPSLDRSNDQAWHGETADRTPTNEEEQKEEKKRRRAARRDPLDERAAAIAVAAVAAINAIDGAQYQADAKDTRKLCRALAADDLTPDDVARAVDHVGRSWKGTQYPIRPATLLQAKRVRTALEDLAARGRRDAKPANASRPLPPLEIVRFDDGTVCNIGGGGS